jgi:hypothetical protein
MQQGHHHHPAFAAQPFMQQDQMPLMRRVRHAAPTQQGQLPRPAAQPGNGARQPPAQPAPPGVLQQQQPAPVPARASAAGSRPAATKSAGGQARPGNAHAQVAAGSKSKLPRTAASGAPAAAAALEKAPSSESDADWAVLHDLKLGDGPSCWADLVDGILQQVCLARAWQRSVCLLTRCFYDGALHVPCNSNPAHCCTAS